MKGMYMEGTLPRLGCVNYVQNVYKLFLYKCTQKPVDSTSVHKTCLLVNNERNVQGQNIKECTLPRLGFVNCVQNVYKLLMYKCTQNSLLYKCIQKCVQTGWH